MGHASDARGPSRRGEAAARPVPRRRPADAAVWRARLSWAKAAEDAAEIERAVRHLPPDRVGPAEILDLRAWFAARAGDAERERKAHQDLLAREPGSLRSLDRLAALALEAGRRDEADRLRRRQAALTETKYRYQAALQILTNANIPDAARMAEELGRNFEAQRVDAGRPGRPERSCRRRGRGPAEGGGSPAPGAPLDRRPHRRSRRHGPTKARARRGGRRGRPDARVPG